VVAHPGPADPALRAALVVIGSLSPALRLRVEVVEAPTPDSVTLGLRDGRTVVWGGAGDSAAKARALGPLLSIYLGYADPKSTYWYLQATPELLAAAADRLERSGAGR
jgi:hypothetical protein